MWLTKELETNLKCFLYSILLSWCVFSILTQSLHGVALQDSPSLSTIETSMHYLQQPLIGIFWASMHLFSKPPSGLCSIIGRWFIAWKFSSTIGLLFFESLFFFFFWYLVGIYCVSQETIKSHPMFYVQ